MDKEFNRRKKIKLQFSRGKLSSKEHVRNLEGRRNNNENKENLPIINQRLDF
jgi:hypothetical protein